MRFLPRSLVLILFVISAGSAAPQEKSAPAPAAVTGTDPLPYLKQTIDWYQHLRVEQQLVTDPADVTFLDDERQIAKQILKLSFDFARAQAKFVSTAPVASQPDQPESTRYSGLMRRSAAADEEVKQTEAEVESVKRKLQQTPEGQQKRNLQANLDELQSELNLARTRSETFRSILQFVGTGGLSAANLLAQIDELQNSIPELEPGAKSAPAPAPANAASNRVPQNTGILDLMTSLFALSRKMQTLDQAFQATDDLASSAQKLRGPLVKNMLAAAQRGEELAKEADTSGPAQLQQQKRELDALTNQFKDISSVVVPIGRQNILFGLYKSGLTRWKAAIQNQYSVQLKSLLVKVAGLGFALAVVFVLGEIWRKATLRYVRDIRRRYQFLLLRRIVLWCAVGITVAFALATEIGSLATFAGLITAGIAVALQNVILAIAGYFFLVGKYGVRVGDRVQISGVTGNVVDIGLIRLHLMELAGTGTDRQPTGRVVVFSNSIVFQPAASFFKQIPGTNFGWHEVTLILSPDSDYRLAEERIMSAVEAVYAKYRDKIEEQHRHVEKTFTLGLEIPQPKSRLRLTQSGLEVVVRYPLELENSSEIDDQIIRELLTALDKPPKLKLVGTGTPNIQPVLAGNTAT
jgi:small-conductance mechanosensitive channel